MNDPLIHTLDDNQTENKKIKPVYIITIFTISLIVGIGAAFISSSILNTKTKSSKKTVEVKKGSQVMKAGVKDLKEFKDKATGVLKEGGVDGEGSFHLERPGGESQNVYLTSSTVDLSQFLNKKVEVWGKTYSSKKAGWLMDVGYIEVK